MGQDDGGQKRGARQPHRHPGWRRLGRGLAGLGLSGLALWLCVRPYGTARVAAAAAAHRRALAGGPMAAWAAALLAVQAARAARWAGLIATAAPQRPRQAWRQACLGSFWTLVLPLRLGELYRPTLLWRQQQVPWSTTVAVVAVERALDAATLLALVAVAGLGAGQAGDWARRLLPAPATLALMGGGLGALGLLAAWLGRRGPVAPGRRPLAGLLGAARRLGRPRQLLPAVGWTLFGWGAQAAGLWALVAGAGLVPAGSLAAAHPLAAAAGWAAVLNLGLLLPAAPGMVGTYQAAMVLGLGLAGVEGPAVVALAVLAHLTNVLVVVASALPLAPWPGRPPPT